MATTIDVQTRQSVTRPKASSIPPLENGDRLTRIEFERRYEAMPRLKKAELIEGVVYIQAAVRFEQHGRPHSDLVTWMGVYRAQTPGTEIGDNTTVRFDPDNELQPDIFLRIAPDCGGESRNSPEGFIEGAPELIVEIAASSASFDLHDKLHVYRRSGVREYIVWKVLDEEIVWFELQEERFVPIAVADDGLYHSGLFPGLQLDAAALLNRDMTRVLKSLQAGIDSSDHTEFVTKLQQATEKK